MILALLVGCALRRQELATLEVETIQLREGRWVLADLEGNGRRIRTVAVPVWVKQGINVWMTAAGIEEGRLLRSISKGGKVDESLGDWAVLVGGSAIGEGDRHRALWSPRPAPHLCQALPQERRGSGADKVPAGALVHPDHRAISRFRTGY